MLRKAINMAESMGVIQKKQPPATPQKKPASVKRQTAFVSTQSAPKNKKKKQFNRRVAAKAMTLMKEGKPRKQAFAMAYNFAGANGKDRLGNAKG